MKVLDLSALWAGPLCGAVFAEMGASVIKAEIVSRPDSTRIFMPEFFRRLNGRKTDLRLDFSKARDQTRLHDEILESDVVITSSRPRAFASWGLSPETVFAANPNLVWVAITGYGWTGDDALRVAFGDDAAAAGGLLHWSQEGLPEFLGDALADPVTGMVAAAAALRSILAGGGVLIDAALARCAAEAAAICRCQNHA
jgi:crotonobetainyl-CoA:carnitine CoA-transferase CaiB-like acyl-CoA transferase